ncbi:MAG: FoF1 ATP synthase subunit a [Dehalococcoidia bacterium]
MPGRGMSTKMKVTILVALILALLIVGFLSGELAKSMFDTTIDPLHIELEKPHLPAQPVTDPLFGDFSLTNTILAAWVSIILLVGVCYAATRKMKAVPSGLQNLVEAALEALLNFVQGVAGEKNGRRFFPVIATIFLFVITNAWLGLLPGFGSITAHGPEGEVMLLRNASTDINVPLALALVSFVVVEFWGLSAVGFSSYMRRFVNLGRLRLGMGQLLRGKLKSAATSIFSGAIDVFVGALEALSEVMRIVSFTFRLFGNMTAGEILLIVVPFLVPWVVALPFYGLELLVGFVQALIFAGLTLVFAVIAVAPHGAKQETA